MMPYQYYPMANQQQVYQVNQLNGRAVNDFNEITANDVPMTGGYAFFPKADMSEIAVKSWTNQGLIATRLYKPISAPLEPQVENDKGIDVEGLFGAITERLDRIEKSVCQQKKRVKNEPTANTSSDIE